MMHIIMINHCSPHLHFTKFVFNKIQISLPNFAFFTLKSFSSTLRSVSQEMFSIRANTCQLFFAKLQTQINFNLIESL